MFLSRGAAPSLGQPSSSELQARAARILRRLSTTAVTVSALDLSLPKLSLPDTPRLSCTGFHTRTTQNTHAPCYLSSPDVAPTAAQAYKTQRTSRHVERIRALWGQQLLRCASFSLPSCLCRSPSVSQPVWHRLSPSTSIFLGNDGLVRS